MIDAIVNLRPEYIVIIMTGVTLFAIFIGFPISLPLIFLGMLFGMWGFGELVFYLMTLEFSSVMLEQTLAAVPLFIFMGILMEQAGLMERLFKSVQLALSRTHGSLYIAVVCLDHLRCRDRNCGCLGYHTRYHGG